ncbi:hypothetical protein LDB25A_051 [Lactobacillus phage Ld25A]|uniref:HNH nuclease domain-containing protein n=1 Tax=Lactobacillus phage Ld25A TaxID=1500734 RepID=A0A075KK56_9CAUD|nr:HNH endonuclease [Lactobacillus phage Ld25A]AIF54375.1 hypothetical protein LDB25A_051 [Lactobacillus phage Ld25A]
MTDYISCARCGRIHAKGYVCKVGKRRKHYRYDYAEAKLRNTYKWHKKSEEIRERSKYLCSVCLDEGKYNYRNLEVHHITKLRVEPSLLLVDSNLICLCREHHRLADAGMIDDDYLRELARRRDEES